MLQLQDSKKGALEHSLTPPRIPPRQHIPRTTVNIPAANSHEAVIEFTHGSGISKVQISSTANSPLLSKASSAIAASSPPTANNAYFMRGNFKSNSVNYGNLVRRPVGETKVNGIGVASSRLTGHPSPQMFHMPASRNLHAVHMSSARSSYVTQSQTATSVHSDSSTSHDSEKEVDASMLNNNINTNTANQTSAAPMIQNGRSRILVNGSATSVVEPNLKSNSQNSIKPDSVQLSNAINNNAEEGNTSTSNQNCTNQITTDSNSNNSNSIWYEYGCV